MSSQKPSSDTAAVGASASYASPTSLPFTVIESVSLPTSLSTADKAAYLRRLRKAVASMQDNINKELTARMEEDKARHEAATGGAAQVHVVDDAKEEENYGEEVQGED